MDRGSARTGLEPEDVLYGQLFRRTEGFEGNGLTVDQECVLEILVAQKTGKTVKYLSRSVRNMKLEKEIELKPNNAEEDEAIQEAITQLAIQGLITSENYVGAALWTITDAGSEVVHAFL